MEYELIKCHGSGNDFLLIDEISHPYSFTESERSRLTQLLCDRKNGIGADGILFVLESNRGDARMRVFNADGSEASMCGNGLRCVARYVCELKGINKAVVETMKADLKVEKREEMYPEVATYQVEISPVSLQTKDLPLNIEKTELMFDRIPGISDSVEFSALAVPNPHLVAIVKTEQVISDEQKKISEYLNGPNEFCPDGVNVSFVKDLKPGHIYVRTFERGVGFTNACGTAMSASTLVTCIKGINEFEKEVNVYNNGGKVQCVAHKEDGRYHIDLIGNATYLFKCTVDVENSMSSYQVVRKNELEEQGIFSKLQTEVQTLLKDWM
ncbi:MULTISPECIES: diaminopimelate epimerase [unclassified Bacillus (in: firmicutes)]|uniref:diaminopimelate epimerase n=1 Tax=unclassified Bacillus (in: firmicutes) TaxID=185979 RepID=UPI0008F22444|nr:MULTISPECIES: diaminopimelate epimerase [unclassified Bacillus (in: firmicutes)]SFA91802.1 diaminopimelate epimerase [Bacillus sp. UNCCL13]SFQ85673.1 diaminopimelate epimerase [Bacillus sp. cl95]